MPAPATMVPAMPGPVPPPDRTLLTISQLADAAGVTVRAVRHYHATGLLPEPERDSSGYRRYPAAVVVDLVRIRVLADAGVPLSRVRELLEADDATFAAALDDVDRRLRAEIRERQEHRHRIGALAAGDGLALPPDVVEYLARARELGFREEMVRIERDSWLLIAARHPGEVGALMRHKRAQLEEPAMQELYRDFSALLDGAPGDPRLTALADRMTEFLVETLRRYGAGGPDEVLDEPEISPELVELLDELFVQTVPAAPHLLGLLRQRGWVGWTRIRPAGPR